MKTKIHSLLLCTAMLFFACSGTENQSTIEETIEVEESTSEIKIVDTVTVSTLLIKVMGVENMIQGPYVAGQTEEDFMQAETSFEKLVNVDVKGSLHAPKEEEKEFSEKEQKSISTKMKVFNLIELHKGEVEQPFRVSVVTKVKDFRTWKMLYDMEEKNRQNAGMTLLQMGLNKDDANEVFMLIAIPDIAKAREMMTHPGLETKMEQSGVIGIPVVKFWRPAGPQSEKM